MDAQDLCRAEWRTSTYSGGSGSCVEVARNLPGIIAIRDSKNRDATALAISHPTWSAILRNVRNGGIGR